MRELTYGLEFATLMDLGHTRDAWRLGRAWMNSAQERGDVGELHALVSEVLEPRPKVWMLDLELALQASKTACEWTGRRDPQLLAQLARIHYLRGEFTSACRAMERALERALRGSSVNALLVEEWTLCQGRYDRAARGH